MKKRLIISLIFITLFSTYKPQKLNSLKKFNIEEILIENNYILKKEEIKKKLSSIYQTNLLFLDYSNIEEILKKNSFIKSFEIKKIYPNKIKITIIEKKPIAILHYKKKTFYISRNINFIEYIDLKNYNNLPNVFGGKDNFKSLYNELKKINFQFHLIKNFYFYEAKRWDLETYENQIIKLPVKNYTKSLENFMNFKKKYNFDNYKVFDYRINGQLILK